MNVPIGGLVVAIGMQVFALYLVTRLPKFWRGDLPLRYHTALAMTGYEGAKNRFAVRSIAVVAVIGSVFAATLIALAFITPKSTAGWIVIGLIPVEAVLMVGLMVTIALFNRPKCLIPPMMRDRT